MACEECDWEKVVERAETAAQDLPDWMTGKSSFLLEVAETMKEKEHCTERQLEVVEDAERQVEEQ